MSPGGSAFRHHSPKCDTGSAQTSSSPKRPHFGESEAIKLIKEQYSSLPENPLEAAYAEARIHCVHAIQECKRGLVMEEGTETVKCKLQTMINALEDMLLDKSPGVGAHAKKKIKKRNPEEEDSEFISRRHDGNALEFKKDEKIDPENPRDESGKGLERSGDGLNDNEDEAKSRQESEDSREGLNIDEDEATSGSGSGYECESESDSESEDESEFGSGSEDEAESAKMSEDDSEDGFDVKMDDAKRSEDGTAKGSDDAFKKPREKVDDVFEKLKYKSVQKAHVRKEGNKNVALQRDISPFSLETNAKIKKLEGKSKIIKGSESVQTDGEGESTKKPEEGDSSKQKPSTENWGSSEERNAATTPRLKSMIRSRGLPQDYGTATINRSENPYWSGMSIAPFPTSDLPEMEPFVSLPELAQKFDSSLPKLPHEFAPPLPELQECTVPPVVAKQNRSSRKRLILERVKRDGYGRPSPPDFAGVGLRNLSGENHCFMNVNIQSLRHLKTFHDHFLDKVSSEGHMAVGHDYYCSLNASKSSNLQQNCFVCALHILLTNLTNASQESPADRRIVDPTILRSALSQLQPEGLFKEGATGDASEAMNFIFKCLHAAFNPLHFLDSSVMPSTDECTPDCRINNCLVHLLFGMNIREGIICEHCGREARLPERAFLFHHANTSSLTEEKAKKKGTPFDELLKFVVSSHKMTCDIESGGCGKENNVNYTSSAAPKIFIVLLGWASMRESVDMLAATFGAIEEEIDISKIYDGLDPGKKHRLTSMVCYAGVHYICFIYHKEHLKWALYDDAAVEEIGGWTDVLSLCKERHYQPQMLFYEAA